MPAAASSSRLYTTVSDLEREFVQTLLDSELVALCGLRDDRIVAPTPAFRHLFGGDVPPDETLLERVAPEDRERVASALNEVGHLRSPPISFRGIRFDGLMLQAEMVATRTRRDDGDLVVAMVSDVTERTANEEQLSALAFYDALTVLPNRLLFQDRIEHALAAASRTGLRFAPTTDWSSTPFSIEPTRRCTRPRGTGRIDSRLPTPARAPCSRPDPPSGRMRTGSAWMRWTTSTSRCSRC